MAETGVRSPKATVRCVFCETLNRVDLSRLARQPKCGSCGRPILLDRPLPITDDSFDRVISDTDVPVVVDFYADWCGPCKMMAPIFDEFAREKQGQLLVAKLDTDRNQATSQRFNVRGIPTLIVFSKGKEVGRQVGAVPRAALDQLVARAGAA